jgi:hypothetical protein
MMGGTHKLTATCLLSFLRGACYLRRTNIVPLYAFGVGALAVFARLYLSFFAPHLDEL